MNKHKQNKTTHKNYIIRVEGKNAFHRGDTFTNFEQVADRLQAHTQESLVYYWIRDSRLVKYAHTKVSRKIDEQLQYYSIKFSCIFGGQRFKSKAKGVRPCKRQTRQMDCPAFITLRATKCGRKLEVIDVCNDHTHEISEQAIEALPQKRRPSQGLLEEIQELLHLNVDKKMIIDYVKQKENKNILRKDLFNIATHLRLEISRTRSVDEQKPILQRITLSATEDAIQHAVLRKLLQFESDFPLNPVPYEESVKSIQNTLDMFGKSTPSAIDFTTLPPEIDLLNTTDGGKDQIEYDELLSNRIVVDYEEEELLEEKPKIESITSPPIQDNKWIEVTTRPTVIYEDFICGDDTSYTYEELELKKEIPNQNNVETSISNSPVSHHSQDLDEKEYFNDLILKSPSEIYPTDEALDVSSGEECGIQEFEIETAYEDNEVCLNSMVSPKVNEKKSIERLTPKEVPKYFARKTRRMIMNCRNCGVNARLIKMQISYLRQQRRKLFQETEILRLKKQKLQAEIDAIHENSLL